ncbi:hypothetical protein [Pseudomonas zeae]|uniref:hypothetical protein n=1 Tax=Pseudomonas zeae TaxID=2745510 RepID=UPI0039DFBEE4
MPLIQIEQDSPKVLLRSREQISSMAAEIRQTPGEGSRHDGLVMLVVGYLAALLLNELVSPKVYAMLQSELNQAREAAEATVGAGRDHGPE